MDKSQIGGPARFSNINYDNGGRFSVILLHHFVCVEKKLDFLFRLPNFFPVASRKMAMQKLCEEKVLAKERFDGLEKLTSLLHKLKVLLFLEFRTLFKLSYRCFVVVKIQRQAGLEPLSPANRAGTLFAFTLL